jgi:hypothetical protein
MNGLCLVHTLAAENHCSLPESSLGEGKSDEVATGAVYRVYTRTIDVQESFFLGALKELKRRKSTVLIFF